MSQTTTTEDQTMNTTTPNTPATDTDPWHIVRVDFLTTLAHQKVRAEVIEGYVFQHVDAVHRPVCRPRFEFLADERATGSPAGTWSFRWDAAVTLWLHDTTEELVERLRLALLSEGIITEDDAVAID